MPQLKIYSEAETQPLPTRRNSSLRVKPILANAKSSVQLGPFAVIDNSEDVVSAELNLSNNSIQVTYLSTIRSTPREVCATFADGTTADAVFAILKERLGAGWRIQPVMADVKGRAVAPLGTLVGILLATVGMALAAAVAEDGGLQSEIIAKWDWRWICGLGGMAAATAQVWLYRRVTAPPTLLELVRG